MSFRNASLNPTCYPCVEDCIFSLSSISFVCWECGFTVMASLFFCLEKSWNFHFVFILSLFIVNMAKAFAKLNMLLFPVFGDWYTLQVIPFPSKFKFSYAAIS